MEDLIELLKRKQAESGLTNVEFARLYGVDETSWSRFKGRKRPLTMEFLGFVLKNHPYDTSIPTAVTRYIVSLQTVMRVERLKEGLKNEHN
jgi:hypothetical protein